MLCKDRRVVATVILALATVAAGATAGVFLLYAIAIMPGLRRVDDRTFVAAFQAIDRAIVNPVFIGGCFLGTLVLSVAAALLHLGDGGRGVLPWLVAAAGLHVMVIVITATVHLPRNDAIKAAGAPGEVDAVRARSALDERRWARWNHVRVALALATAGCLATALAS
jgi:uncharacterized membrane protein